MYELFDTFWMKLLELVMLIIAGCYSVYKSFVAFIESNYNALPYFIVTIAIVALLITYGRDINTFIIMPSFILIFYLIYKGCTTVTHVIISCEKCEQKLIVPQKTMKVTCPTCRAEFEYRSTGWEVRL
jgi:hypothetical protein